MKLFTEGKSLCTCGHVGDGEDTPHRGLIGHGACTVPGCSCLKFTWRSWTPAYETVLKKTHKELDK